MMPFPAVILAGGESRRMGGGDKFLLPFGEGTLISHIAQRLAKQAGPLAVSANCDPALLGDLDLPVLADGRHARRGPLSGVLAGLDWAAELGVQSMLTVAADTPFFPPDLVDRLAEASVPEAIIIARSDGRPHPTFALWPVSLRDRLDEFLSSGPDSSVMAFIRSNTHRFADFASDTHDPFFNINTPDDLKTAIALRNSEI